MGSVVLPIGATNSGTNDWSDVHGEDQAIIDVLNGNVDADNLAANIVTQSETSTSFITSGTYTPTAFNYTNLSAVTPSVFMYFRVGGVVYVSGLVDVNAVTASTFASFDLTLPIASSLTAAANASGTGAAVGAADPWAIYGEPTNDRVSLFCATVTIDTQTTVATTFSYRVL